MLPVKRSTNLFIIFFLLTPLGLIANDNNKTEVFILSLGMCALLLTVLLLLKALSNLKRLKKELINKNLEAKLLLENKSVAIFLSKNTNTICDVNKKALEMLGYTKEELLNQNLKIIHLNNQSYENFASSYRLLLKKGISCINYPFKTKNGNIIWCAVYYNHIKINNENKIVWSLIDITEKKLMLNQIKQTNQELELALDATKVGLWA